MHRRDLLQRSASALLCLALGTAGLPALAQSAAGHGVELTQLGTERGEEGLLLSYTLRFELPREVEDALYKGVAVVFVAETELFRRRWYWSDESRSTATRRWRLAYQPLTRHWRLSMDGLARSYNSLNEALSVLRRAPHWRIADNVPMGDERDYYVEFSFKLDTGELPRPLQIGLGGQNEWNLSVQRVVNLAPGR